VTLFVNFGVLKEVPVKLDTFEINDVKPELVDT
jgi:hypothetical protein